MTTRKNNRPRTLSALGERGFIKKILGSASPSFVVPPGDDAVVLRNPGHSVLSIDGLTEGTHFRSSWSKRCKQVGGFSLGRGLGWKLIGSSLSDLAAMGKTTHRWVMVYLGAPGNTPLDFLAELQKGVREAARKFNCALAGGDTVNARDLSLVAAVGGDSKGTHILRRKGARPGDLICVAGTIGDAAIGLKLLEGKSHLRSRADSAYFVRRFFQHEPLFEAASFLAEEKGVTSAIDLSDAFLDSVQIMGEASKVGARIHVERIPLSKTYQRWFKWTPDLLTGGEDYSLLFTLRAEALSRLRRLLSFSVVGHVVPASQGIVYSLRGSPLAPPRSFQHFS